MRDHRPLSVNPGAIPDELKDIPHWVLWKDNKRPVQPDGKSASSTSPQTWCTYAKAIEAWLDGRFSGLGFVLTDDLGITVVDFDDCAEGNKPHPDLIVLLDSLNTYTERSPSGKGFHSWLFGKKPGTRCKTAERPGVGIKAAEFYSDARYITVTGHILEDYPTKLQSRQSELNSLYAELLPAHERNDSGSEAKVHGLSDRRLIEVVRASAQADKFASLYDSGDVSRNNNDDSAADMALCSILAFWTAKDGEQIDRIFRESALHREKWDEKRGEKTYGEITISKAIRSTKDVCTPSLNYTPLELNQMIEDTDDEFELMERVANAITDSGHSASVTHSLRKRLAKKAQTTIKALESDAREHSPIPESPNQLDIAHDAIAEYGSGNLIHAQGAFYSWSDSGVWRSLDDQHVKQRIHKVSNDDEITGNTVESTLKLARTESFVSDVAFGAPFDGINCLNGELQFLEGHWQLRPHQKSRFLVSQVPVEYSPSADAPASDNLWRKCLPEIPTLWINNGLFSS
ncbi:hypothetical protein OAS69_01255 [Pseudomonadales bacterium]|nr:hypothetical protein [Pseudomonadales bacterium]